MKEANKIAEYYGSYAKSLQTKQNAGNLFEAANKIYLRSGFSILPTFQESVKKYYGDKSFESVDFGQSETAAKVNYFLLYLIATGMWNCKNND